MLSKTTFCLLLYTDIDHETGKNVEALSDSVGRVIICLLITFEHEIDVLDIYDFFRCNREIITESSLLTFLIAFKSNAVSFLHAQAYLFNYNGN